MPKEYGTLIKWYFPVPPSYWGGRVQRRERWCRWRAVKFLRLRKAYSGGKVAVHDLSFGMKRGECFGFHSLWLERFALR
ncbi:hypothetical protein PI125_g711 [Phytophthora idaei]|nr:hypothetical protein PI125_g711 [Phytophthora idaei]